MSDLTEYALRRFQVTADELLRSVCTARLIASPPVREDRPVVYGQTDDVRWDGLPECYAHRVMFLNAAGVGLFYVDLDRRVRAGESITCDVPTSVEVA